jgi:hypothetical protein
MWKRAFASWDGKTSDTVGIHCNFLYTQAGDFLHAPYSTLKKNEDGSLSLVNGASRIGYLRFYHATAGQDFHLYDDIFTDMAEDMQDSAPTAEDPSPAEWIPNAYSNAWMKEFGSDQFVDAFSKTRYRNNICVLLNWENKKVDPGGHKYWTQNRLVIISMKLDTDSLDLAAEAYKCKVNILGDV